MISAYRQDLTQTLPDPKGPRIIPPSLTGLLAINPESWDVRLLIPIRNGTKQSFFVTLDGRKIRVSRVTFEARDLPWKRPVWFLTAKREIGVLKSFVSTVAKQLIGVAELYDSESRRYYAYSVELLPAFNWLKAAVRDDVADAFWGAWS